MKSSAKKIELASVDDLFSTEEGRQDAKLEKIQEIPLSELHPFKNHPFKVKDDEAMMETADSIKQYGVLVPAIARPDPEGGYELVAGHRRHRASELAEKETMPVIVRDLDDDAATIIMVDSNLQRESLLPSERAFAYKMKLEAMKHQGERVDLTSSQVGTKLRADEILAQQAGSSRNQVQRYIRLTELIPELMDMVDEKKIALNPAYELSFLKKEEQVDLLDAMDSEQATPSLSQAQRLKKYSQEGYLTLDMMRVIMGEEKKSDLDRVTFTSDTLRKYFPKSYTPQRMQETISVIIAGMGGQLISEILSADTEKARECNLVLQPMNAQYELRKYLISNGFSITDEDIAIEGFKVYNIMNVINKPQKEFDNDIEYHLPKYLVNHKYYKNLYDKKHREFVKVITGLENSKDVDENKLNKYKYWLKELNKYES